MARNDSKLGHWFGNAIDRVDEFTDKKRRGIFQVFIVPIGVFTFFGLVALSIVIQITMWLFLSPESYNKHKPLIAD